MSSIMLSHLTYILSYLHTHPLVTSDLLTNLCCFNLGSKPPLALVVTVLLPQSCGMPFLSPSDLHIP